MPTMRKATAGPLGLSPGPAVALFAAAACDRAKKGTWITVPTWTPLSCCRVIDASA